MLNIVESKFIRNKKKKNLNSKIKSCNDRSKFLVYRAVVRELIETEEEFVRDLNHVVDKYIKTVENQKSKPPKAVIDNKEIIFGNFRQIAEFHKT